MQDKKQQLETDMEQLTGSKLGKEYDKAVYCYPAYLTYMQFSSVAQLSPTLCDPMDAACQASLCIINSQSFFKLDFNSIWSKNFQINRLDLEKAEEPKIKLPTSTGS